MLGGIRRVVAVASQKRGVGAFYLARIAPGALNFLLVLVLGALLESDEYGRFSIWISLCLGGGAFFFGWIAQSVARHANAKDDVLGQQPEVFVAGIAATIAGLFVVVVALYWVVPILSASYVVLLAIGMMLHGLHTVFSAVMQARFEYRRYFVVEVLRPAFIFFAVVSLAWWVKASAASTISGYVLGQSLGLLCALMFAWRALPVWRRTNGSRVLLFGALTKLRSMFIYGAPLSLWLGLSLGWPALDRIVLGLLSDPVEVGMYAFEFDVAFRSFVFVLLPLTLFAQPHIFRDFSSGSIDAVRRTINQTILAQTVLGLLYTAVYVTAISLLSRSVEEFATMRMSNVIVLCLAAISWQVALICHKGMECGKRIVEMFLALVCAVFLVALPLAVMLFSYVGSQSFAIGVLVAGVAYAFYCYQFGMKRVLV